MANLYNLLLMLDGAIYNLIDYLYDIFDFLAGRNIFSQDTYNDIVSRIYIILGVFMLFVLAYSLLKAIINPDDFAKGENSFPNLIKNVVVSLVIIVLLPTVFSVAFNIQNSILNNDTIPKLILGTDYATNTDVYDADAGRTMAYYTFMAFFHENEDWCGNPEVNGTGTVLTVGDGGSCADEILGNGALFVQNGLPLSEIRAGVLREDSFSNFSEFGEAVEEGQINYMFIISTFGGIFILYVLLNFCFDMALRVIKLAFYQIIAPIPVICRILPGGNMKDVFSNWTKQVISIFFEVFIRIGIMNLGVFLITTIVKNFNGIPGLSRLTFTQELIVQALLIMGVVTFIRQAPDLLSKLLKLDTGGMKLGLMDKLAMGGGLVAGAAAGGAVSMFAKNAVAAGKNFHATKGQGFKARASALAGGAASVVAGTTSGVARAGFGARSAKNFKDMKGAASKGIAGAAAAKTKRAAYKASHRNVSIAGHNFDVGKIPLVGGAIGVGAGHASDLVHGAAQWAGLDGSLEHLKAEQAVYQEGMGFKKELFDLVSDNESVMAYQGLKKSAQERDLAEYTNFYKLNANGEVYDKRTGALLKDKDGNIFKNAEAAAIFSKTQEIEKYDTAIKLASMRAIHEKLQSGDGRFTAQFEKFETYKRQHADNELVKSLTMQDIDQSQLDLINQALSTNNYSDIDSVKKVLESTAGGILYNDKQFKIKNGDVTTEIARRIQEKKEKDK